MGTDSRYIVNPRTQVGVVRSELPHASSIMHDKLAPCRSGYSSPAKPGSTGGLLLQNAPNGLHLLGLGGVESKTAALQLRENAICFIGRRLKLLARGTAVLHRRRPNFSRSFLSSLLRSLYISERRCQTGAQVETIFRETSFSRPADKHSHSRRTRTATTPHAFSTACE